MWGRDDMEQARFAVGRPPTSGKVDRRGDPPIMLTGVQCYHVGAVCVALVGALDIASNSAFRASVTLATKPTDNLVLDLRAVRSIDSTGIHALLDIYQMLILRGRHMALVAAPPRIQRVLAAFDIDEILPVFATVDAALANFRDGS
jgi:anti-sigma B factor antagonist